MAMTHAPRSKTEAKKAQGFGVVFCDEILAMEFQESTWNEPRVEAYAPLVLDPATACLHYGQTIFEGLKAHRQGSGEVGIFRLRDHLERFNASATRMCMPTVDVEATFNGIVELVGRQAINTPEPPGSLYIRPMMIASGVGLGVKPSLSYRFMVLLSPVQSYFGSLAGIRLRTETKYSRAAPGGTGNAKCGGNYAGSLIAQQAVIREGFQQVLWLDAVQHRYVEELSAMNFLMIDDGVLVSPPESDTVLASMTNRSIFALAEDLGIPHERRPVPIESLANSSVSEVFCCGTAAVVTHVFEVVHEGRSLFKRTTPGPVASRLHKALTEIQQGLAPDPHGWLTSAGTAS